MQRVIERLPFSLRQRWCDVADDITNNKHREITFEDIASFVESKARAFNHPVYGAINTERRNQGKTSNDRRPWHSDNFATLVSSVRTMKTAVILRRLCLNAIYARRTTG